ncbi:MAG: DUF2357 domain-containing protein [Sphingobacteriia bacterium]|nr:DUF2357 domain-containing protein [Sphingobacteriia bacterium]
MSREASPWDGDVGAAPVFASPPELPALDALEALAASESPSLSASWWITHQVTEHVFSAIARTDPLTGNALPQPLTELLEGIETTTASGLRPFPDDRLFVAARFAADPFARLLDSHRHRIVRSHAQLPFHRLREVDTRSLAWLARQPGRNVREKLSGRTHALVVKRELTADTTENRLLCSFARLIVCRAGERLAHAQAYDVPTAADPDRIGALSESVHLYDERLRRSGLSDLPTLARIRPNNVLLGDPLYSRVYRAWKWLRDEEDGLQRAWPHALSRARSLLCWMVAARLSATARFAMMDNLGRVMTGRAERASVGIEILGTEDARAAWQPNPPLRFLVRPGGATDSVLQVRLGREGDCLLVRLASLESNGAVREASVREFKYEIESDPTRIAPKRGVAIAIHEPDGAVRDHLRGYADLSGLRHLASQLVQQILKGCCLSQTAPQTARGSSFEITDTARIGVEFGSTALRVTDDRPEVSTVAAWTVALDLPGEAHSVEWLDGRADRRVAVGAAGRSIWSMGDVLDPDSDAHSGTLSLVARRLVQCLATERALPADARIAYTVADAIDEFSQRALRAAVGSCFTYAVPVWRSVAAAMAWGISPDLIDQGPKPGDSVVVVDTEYDAVTLTVLAARYDPGIEREIPESRGIYWERKPPIPPDEQLEMLGWMRVVQAYAQLLVARALPNEPSGSRRDRIAKDLVRVGAISDLIEHGGSLWTEVSSCSGEHDVLEIKHDPEWLDREIARWFAGLEKGVEAALRSLSPAHRSGFRLIVGGPSAHERLVPQDRMVGRIKFFHEDKGWGFLELGRIEYIRDAKRCDFVPHRDGSRDVFVHISSLRDGTGQRLISDQCVELDVVEGVKGQEARAVAPMSPLRRWRHKRTIAISPHKLSAGGRQCLGRLDAGCLAWKEWLPDLSLEVVRDGHYGEISLLKPDASVDPFFGAAMEIEVSETITLARGRKWYSLPLIVGRQERRPVAWEARIESPAFPLDRDLPVTLRLIYRYGMDSSYELVVEPKFPAIAPFGRLAARWIRAGESSRTQSHPRPSTIPAAPAPPADWDKFINAAGSLERLGDDGFARFLSRMTENCWSQGRSVATAPPHVRIAFEPFRERLLRGLLGPADSIQDVPRELEILARLHEDAPVEAIALILRLEEEAAEDIDSYKKAAALLGMIVGDGIGDRSAVLNRLLKRLERHSGFDSFAPALVSATMGALSRAAWRDPRFMASLAAIPGAQELLIGQCRRTFQNLLARVPIAIEDSEREKIAKMYAKPYCDACELLLAMLRLGEEYPATAMLRCGSALSDVIAKSVRQLDSRFCAGEIDPRWNVRLTADLPAALHRMSPAAFVLNLYLAEGGGVNLIHVAGTATDESDSQPPDVAPAGPIVDSPPSPSVPTTEPPPVPAEPALTVAQAERDLLALRDRIFAGMACEIVGFKNWHNMLQGPVVSAALAARCTTLESFLELAELRSRMQKYPAEFLERQVLHFGTEVGDLLVRIRYPDSGV